MGFGHKPVDEDDMGLDALRFKLLRSLDALKCARYPQQDAVARDAHLLIILQETLCSGHDRFCRNESAPVDSNMDPMEAFVQL